MIPACAILAAVEALRRPEPLRWFDVDAIDGATAEQLRRGEYRTGDLIPMKGYGAIAMGEVLVPQREKRCSYCRTKDFGTTTHCVSCGAPL